MRTQKLSPEEVKKVLEPEEPNGGISIEIPIGRLLAESFLESCCYSALKSVFILPEGANVFKRFGRFILCLAASDKASRYVVDEVNEIYGTCKETVNMAKEIANEKEN